MRAEVCEGAERDVKRWSIRGLLRSRPRFAVVLASHGVKHEDGVEDNLDTDGMTASAPDAGRSQCFEDVAIGIDIGGTKVAAGVVTKTGGVLHASERRTPRTGDPMKVVNLIVSLLRREMAAASAARRPVSCVGVGTAGVVDRSSGVVISATDNLRGWPGVDLRTPLAAASGLPILVDNDVNAIAIAETSIGVARSFERCLVVSVGTGVGGAIVLDGAVDRGATGTAGEIGHLPIGPIDGPLCSCGRRGHLEAYTSGPSMYREFTARPRAVSVADYRAIVRLARTGDPTATSVVIAGAAVLGRALGGLVNAFDPACVVLAGGVIRSGRLYLDALEDAFRAELLPATARLPILISDPRVRAGIAGAGIAALRAFADADSVTRAGQGARA
jgi:glucokinase